MNTYRIHSAFDPEYTLGEYEADTPEDAAYLCYFEQGNGELKVRYQIDGVDYTVEVVVTRSDS